MEKFKEFHGRDLDESIREACEYFDCAREKLEIEIIQDAKSGIFGIVGARKAKIRARRAQLRDAVQNILGKSGSRRQVENMPEIRREDEAAADSSGMAQNGNARQKQAAPKIQSREPEMADRNNEHGMERNEEDSLSSLNSAALEQTVDNDREDASSSNAPQRASNELERGYKCKSDFSWGGKRQFQEAFQGRPQRKRQQRQFEKPEAVSAQAPDMDDMEQVADGLPFRPIEELDTVRLEELAKEIVGRLVRPVAGQDVNISVELGHGRVRVKVDWQGDAGLLIGREGQTLSAMQYLASLMLSSGMNAALRVQLDIGDYRRRQDDKLRELAKSLAERARQEGRSCSTRPLSSYHRRIIHLLLQNEPDVQTRSSGDGPLKRVVISPRRPAGRA